MIEAFGRSFRWRRTFFRKFWSMFTFVRSVLLPEGKAPRRRTTRSTWRRAALSGGKGTGNFACSRASLKRAVLSRLSFLEYTVSASIRDGLAYAAAQTQIGFLAHHDAVRRDAVSIGQPEGALAERSRAITVVAIISLRLGFAFLRYL